MTQSFFVGFAPGFSRSIPARRGIQTQLPNYSRNEWLVAIHAGVDGQKRLALPGTRDARELLGKGTVAKGASEMKFSMQKGETRVFAVD